MATGAKIVLTYAGWRVKSEYNFALNPHAKQVRDRKKLSGKIARSKMKSETRRLIETE